ncbi:MAG: hypothetical protein DRO18_00255 [Thermoprotei archaeon]|nr:MAG: hypothetical protein DRO18_00255 [Thermoprotei archaeon]
MKECRADEGVINSILLKVNNYFRGNVEIKRLDDGVKGTITVGNVKVFILKVLNKGNLCECYLGIRSKEDLEILKLCGLSELFKVISEYTSYPTAIIISCVRLSRSLYLLITGRELPRAFPHIKVVYRDNVHEISSTFCRIAVDEDTCSLLKNLVKVIKNYFEFVFSST